MKVFRTLFVALAMVFGISTANADEGDHAVGFNFGYAVGDYHMSNFGIGLKYSYQLSDNLRVQPSFMYYFDNEKFAMKDASVDVHYLFNLQDDAMHIYPIFGASNIFGAEREYTMKKGEEAGMDKDKYYYDNDDNPVHKKDKFTRIAFNLGMGYQYDITDDFGLVVEAKYKIAKSFGHFYLAAGCVITF